MSHDELLKQLRTLSWRRAGLGAESSSFRSVKNSWVAGTMWVLGMELGPVGIGQHTRKSSIESQLENETHPSRGREHPVREDIQVEARIL